MKVIGITFLVFMLSNQAWAGISITHCRILTGKNFCLTTKDLVVVWTLNNSKLSVIAQNAYGCEIPYTKNVVLLEKSNNDWRSSDGKISLTVANDQIIYNDLELSADESTPFHFQKSSCKNESFY